MKGKVYRISFTRTYQSAEGGKAQEAVQTITVPDCYDVLGVSRTASLDEIQARFHQLAKELHPDLKIISEEELEKFKNVTFAYSVLTDPQKKAALDLELSFEKVQPPLPKPETPPQPAKAPVAPKRPEQSPQPKKKTTWEWPEFTSSDSPYYSGRWYETPKKKNAEKSLLFTNMKKNIDAQQNLKNLTTVDWIALQTAEKDLPDLEEREEFLAYFQNKVLRLCCDIEKRLAADWRTQWVEDKDYYYQLFRKGILTQEGLSLIHYVMRERARVDREDAMGILLPIESAVKAQFPDLECTLMYGGTDYLRNISATLQIRQQKKLFMRTANLPRILAVLMEFASDSGEYTVAPKTAADLQVKTEEEIEIDYKGKKRQFLVKTMSISFLKAEDEREAQMGV